MLLGLALIACFATVPLTGGRLTRLADLRLDAMWLLLAGLGTQILVIEIVPGNHSAFHDAAHLASYGAVGGFLWANRHRPYLWLIALGGLLNFIAIAANGGVMPADPQALAAAGIEQAPGEFLNSAAVEDARLQFLGDVMWIPAGWPAANVFSVGDVLLLAGAFLALHTQCQSRLALPRFAAPPAPARG